MTDDNTTLVERLRQPTEEMLSAWALSEKSDDWREEATSGWQAMYDVALPTILAALKGRGGDSDLATRLDAHSGTVERGQLRDDLRNAADALRTPPVASRAATGGERGGFAPCPTCRQYSHSIGDDKLANAFNHFQSMYGHPVRGHPMGHHFDEATRDAAQVLMAAARPLPTTPNEELVERAIVAAEYRLHCSPHEWTDADSEAMAQYIIALHGPATSRMGVARAGTGGER